MAARKIRVNRKESNGEKREIDGMVEVSVTSNSGKVSEDGGAPGEYTPGSEDRPGDGVADSDSEERTPTGRKKRKYGPRKGKREQADTPENLTKLLIGSHLMLAKLLDAQELMLTGEEGQEYADAVQQVNSLYSSSWISDEVAAWGNLFIVTAGIYVPRWIAYDLRRKKEKQDNAPIEVPFIAPKEQAS